MCGGRACGPQAARSTSTHPFPLMQPDLFCIAEFRPVALCPWLITCIYRPYTPAARLSAVKIERITGTIDAGCRFQGVTTNTRCTSIAVVVNFDTICGCARYTRPL